MNHEYRKISEDIVKGKREETKVKTWLCSKWTYAKCILGRSNS
jgi:hypothetical protein